MCAYFDVAAVFVKRQNDHESSFGFRKAKKAERQPKIASPLLTLVKVSTETIVTL